MSYDDDDDDDDMNYDGSCSSNQTVSRALYVSDVFSSERIVKIS